MSASARLMRLAGLRRAGSGLPALVAGTAARALDMATGAPALLPWRSHFVHLGAGVNYGITCEGALKRQEISPPYSQASHPMEYRHGPTSLTNERSLMVMLYSGQTATEEPRPVADLGAKVGRVSTSAGQAA